MRVLGLSPLDKDATACAVEDGRILFAAAEERFSRKKQQAGFPAAALDAALKHAGWTARDVDAVAYPFLDAQAEARLIAQAVLDDEAFAKEFLARGAEGLDGPTTFLLRSRCRPASTRRARGKNLRPDVHSHSGCR